jgi:hypothetical protein
MHTAEPSVPEPSASEAEAATGKTKRHKPPGVDQILVDPIKAGRETLHSEIPKLIKFIWNKEELPHQWKESIVVLIHKKGSSNYQGKSLLSTSYKILSNVLLSRLIPHAHEITGVHQCGFQCDKQLI